MSRESDVPGGKYVKSNLSESGAKRPRMDDFMVLDSMDEEDVARDSNMRNWSAKNGPARSDSSAEEGEGRGDEEDDNESFKDALMSEPLAHAEGRISPSLGHHTPDAEPTLPGPPLVERSPSVRVTGVTVIPPDLQTEFPEFKEKIITVSPSPSSKINGLPHTEPSTVSIQNHHPSPLASRRSHESPKQSRSGATHGSSASKHSDYSISEFSDDGIVAKGNNPDSHRRRRSKSKSSVVSEATSSEADDESSQLQAARRLQKEKEEQERETLIREAEKDKLESDAQAIEAEAQAKREQHEASEREERYQTEKARLEKERLGIKQTMPEVAASAKSATEKTALGKTFQAQSSQQQRSQEKPPPSKPTMKADSDKIIHEGMLARRKERSARLKAERDAKATELKEAKEREKLALEEAGRNKELAQQAEEGSISPEEPELPNAAPSEDNQRVSMVEKTDRKIGRTRSKPGKTMAELKTEMDAKEKEKELQKEHQIAVREEKRRAQQEEKERKTREKKEALEKGKQPPKNQELMKVPEANKRVAQEKDLRRKEPQSSSNESENILPPVRNSALRRTDPSNPTPKRPTHVSFADQNSTSSIPPASSPTPTAAWVMKRTPILPPGYIPKASASQQPETSTAPDRAKLSAGATTSMPPPATNGVAQVPLKSKTVGGKQSKATTHETVVKAPPEGKKSPRTRVMPAENPEPKKLVQPNAQPESHSESGSETELETEVDTDSESDSESIDSAREATLATPTPSSKTTKAPLPIIQNTEAIDPPTQTPKKVPAPSSSVSAAKSTGSKVKAKTAVTRYEESTEGSSSEGNKVPSSSSLLPTSAQRPNKPAPQSDSGSDTETATESESEYENPAPPVTGTLVRRMPTTTRPTASSQQSNTNGSQRYKSLTDMELDPIPDVRDVHQTALAAAIMASGKRRLSGPNSSQVRKTLQLNEQEASDDSEGSSDDSSDDSEEEKKPKAKKDALAGKRASVPRKGGFRFRI